MNSINPVNRVQDLQREYTEPATRLHFRILFERIDELERALFPFANKVAQLVDPSLPVQQEYFNTSDLQNAYNALDPSYSRTVEIPSAMATPAETY